MKKYKKLRITILLIALILLSTGCTKTLTDNNKKAVKMKLQVKI